MKNFFIMNEYISSTYNGIGTYIQQLVACLSELKVSIVILTFNSDRDTFCIEEIDNVKYFHFPSFPDKSIHFKIIHKFLRLYIPDSSENKFMINYSPCSSLMKMIKGSHPQSQLIYVIHDMAWAPYFFGDSEKYIKILKSSKKSVAKKYAYILNRHKEEKAMCRYADKIICLSEDTYQLLEKYYSVKKQKLYLIPNTLFKLIPSWSERKKNAFKKKMLLQEDEKILLYVGRITEQKGAMVFLEAFKEIVKVYPACRLIMVGHIINWDCLRKLAYPILSKTFFTGSLLPSELEKWYQIADIGILPSYTEQCSFVGLEMMAHNLPIVASDGFGVRCMFKEGVNAKIAHIGKRNSTRDFKRELINSTLTLLASSITCGNLSRSTSLVFKAKYSINKICELYKSL